MGPHAKKQGSAWSCTTSGDETILSGEIADDDVILRTTDGTNWSTVFTAENGESMSSPVAVPGGFAASGRWTNRFGSVPVVWISSDGADWTPLRIASARPTSPNLIATVGGDLLISLSSFTGEPLMVIRDIASVIEHRAAPPQS